jgi:tetratricopeptide (TPR) repeat protein
LVKRNKKKLHASRTAFWITLAVVFGVFFVAWWIWPGLYNVSPRLNHILLEKNGDFIKLLNGESVRLHPRDRVKIAEVSTNITFNVGIRLTSEGLDVEALTFEKLPIASLMSKEARYRSMSYRVFVKQDNTELGYVDLTVEPYVEDWLDKAARAIDPDLRLSTLEQARAFAPDDEQIRGRLLQEYKAQKKWAKTATLLEEILAKKADEKLLAELLEVYETMGDTKGVVSVLGRLIKENPEAFELRLRLAAVLEKAKRPQEAVKEYEAALKGLGDKEKLAVYKTLGYLYTQMNSFEHAIGAYLKALELDKKDVNLYYNLATLYEKRGDKEKADQFLVQAVDLRPEDMENRIELAEALFRKGNLREAEKFLKEVLEKDPKSTRALLLMVNVLDKQGDKKRLKEVYEKLLALDPKNETVIYNIGILEYETGQWAKSIPYFEKYLKSHPSDPQVHEFLFDLYKKEKKDDPAYKEAQALIALKPDHVEAYRYVFEYADARADYQSVIPLLEKGVKTHPANMELRQFLVLALLKTGKEDAAAEHLRVIAKGRPKDVSILVQLASLQEKQGKYEEALDTYEKILELSPGHKEAGEARISLMLRQARMKERQGNTKEALDIYKKILEIAPGHEEASEAYLRLRLRALPIEKQE